MIEVGAARIDEGEALTAIRRAVPGAGGVVSFTGGVRDEEGTVDALFLQSYPLLTEAGIGEAVRAASRRWSVEAIHVRHRTGWIAPGETIVFVAAAATHRRDAFEAADFMMDMLKTEAIFWKKERLASGEERWIEPRAQDHRDSSRWAANG